MSLFSHGPAARGPLAAAFAAGFDGDASRVAVTDAAGPFSWQSVVRAASEMAGSMGERAGRVGILGISDTDLLIVMLAAAMVGRSACTLHGDWSDTELAAALRDADIEEVFTHRTTLPDGVVIRRPLVVTELSAVDGVADIAAAGTEDPLFYVGFTSGSSGRPKPFTRRQQSWSLSFDAAAELFSISAETQVVLAGSLQHSHFLFGAMLGWSQGAPLRLYERFEPRDVARDLCDTEAAVLYLVPTMVAALDEVEAAPMDNVRSVVVSGAKMEHHHWDIAARLFPTACVAELYGASETSFITVNRRGPVDGDSGYVGVPFPGVELEIRPRDEDDVDHGMVYIRSEFLFEGYLDDGAVVGGVPDDGFITVGDIGTIRADGALSLRGRASNLVITGGKNVHPEEIEIALVAHDSIAECVVVGVPHPYWGEELVACVVTAPDAAAREQELRAFLRTRMAAYKIPKRWLVVERLPRTANGKTDRRRTRLLATQSEPLASAASDPGES